MSRIMRKVVCKEQQDIKDLDLIEDVSHNLRGILGGVLIQLCQVFIRPLRNADLPILQGGAHEFIEEALETSSTHVNVTEICSRRCMSLNENETRSFQRYLPQCGN